MSDSNLPVVDAAVEADKAEKMAQHACERADAARRYAEHALVFALVAVVGACLAYKAMLGIREMLDDLHSSRAA